jgi:hypothetical protein
MKNKRTPKPAVLLHGAAVFIALLIMVAYVASGHFSWMIITSLILFLGAAMGGLTMLSQDLKKKPISKVIAVVHPLVAIAGLIFLIMYVLSIYSA